MNPFEFFLTFLENTPHTSFQHLRVGFLGRLEDLPELIDDDDKKLKSEATAAISSPAPEMVPTRSYSAVESLTPAVTTPSTADAVDNGSIDQRSGGKNRFSINIQLVRLI